MSEQPNQPDPNPEEAAAAGAQTSPTDVAELPPEAGETPAPPSDAAVQAVAEAPAEQPAPVEAAPPAEVVVSPVAEGNVEPDAASGAAVVGNARRGAPAESAAEFQAPELDTSGGDGQVASLDLLDDVQLDVKVELGRAGMYIDDVLKLRVGSVVELDKLAGDPVDIYVNERLIARGEVLVLNENFCVRINGICSPTPELETSK